jgi:membrane protein YdbS with pleckstrin-like domain
LRSARPERPVAKEADYRLPALRASCWRPTAAIASGVGIIARHRPVNAKAARPMSSYVESALIQGERILYLGRVSWWSLVWPYLLLGVLLLPVGIGLVLLIAAWIKRATTEVAVTTHRVIVKRGLIRRDTVELNIQKIESVQVLQGLLGRMFDFGTIAVAGGGNPMADPVGIADPLGFRRAFLEAQEKALAGRTAAAARD